MRLSRPSPLAKSGPDLRREKRVPVRLVMRLEGVSDRGFPLNIQILTENISRSGLCFRTREALPLDPGDRIHGTLENRQVRTRLAMEVKWKADDLIGAQIHLYSEKWLIR